MSEIAVLAGVCVKTLRRRLIPNDDPAVRQFWVQALDLRKRTSGLLGLIHGDAALVRKHLPTISGVDAPL